MDFSLLASILNLLLLLYIISVVIILVLDNRDPDKTVAWILIFLLFPFIGVIVYFYLGQDWKKKQFIKNFQTNDLYSLFKQKEKFTRNDGLHNNAKTQLQLKISHSIERAIGFNVISGNSIRFFDNGKDKFDHLLKELGKAQSYIHMEYYVFKSDNIGKKIMNLLMEKAKKGIEVRLLYDFMGSVILSAESKKSMKKAGVKIQSFFNPLKLFSYHKLNYRNHRKIVIIDGRKAFIGGINVGDNYIDGGKKFKSWRDLHTLVEGNIVHQLQTVFLYDWYLTTRKNIIKRYYFPEFKACSGEKSLQTVYSGPESEWQAIKQLFFLMITNARKSICITTPYFIPDETLFMAVKNAALSGIDVKIIVPSKADYKILFHASRTYFEELMQAGVSIYEYTKGFIHSKIIVVDDETATVGTANFDIRSMQVNFDVNLVLYEKTDVNYVSGFFQHSLSGSKKIELASFKKRRLSLKVVESIARLLSPIL